MVQPLELSVGSGQQVRSDRKGRLGRTASFYRLQERRGRSLLRHQPEQRVGPNASAPCCAYRSLFLSSLVWHESTWQAHGSVPKRWIGFTKSECSENGRGYATILRPFVFLSEKTNRELS